VTTKPLKKGATYDDLVHVPEHYVAEMFDGELYASPRPAFPHARAAGVLLGKLGGSFDFGDGPGGWLIYIEPELHFGNDVLVPDLAGWRRERLPSVPRDAFLTVAPDWICEVLSPSTEYIDRSKKLRIYAREGVTDAWLVDPLRQSLEVRALESGNLEHIEEHHGSVRVRVRPFDAIELELWS
jgi:Uma2 family endonuclease